jgi:hypothetical protein
MHSNLDIAPTTTATAPLRGRVARGGVLVLGGGFAGAYVARQLGRGGATIVNPTNFMLYTPLQPEAAAGNIEPRHVVVPLRTMCPHADLVLGSAVTLDPERRVVEVESEAGRVAVAYADLVIALGSVTRTPPVPGLRDHALGLKDLADAIRLRNHVLRQIELADAAPHTAARRLTFVVAGAGFSGAAPGRARRRPRLLLGAGDLAQRHRRVARLQRVHRAVQDRRGRARQRSSAGGPGPARAGRRGWGRRLRLRAPRRVGRRARLVTEQSRGRVPR